MNLIPVRSDGKEALVRWQEFQRRLPTEEERSAWRARWPDANWGVVTGQVSGVVVLDVDAHRGGTEAIRGRVLPPTRTVRTPSGGWHYYFAHPGHPVPCVPDLLPGVDLKADGGYVLVPPSVINGKRYELAVDEPPAPMPAWLCDAIADHTGAQDGQRPLPAGALIHLLRGVPEGQRNVTATRLVGHWLAKGLRVDEVRELVAAWNARNRPPLDEAALDRVVRSIAKAHTNKRTARSPVAFDAAVAISPEAVQWLWAGRIALRSFAILAGVPGLGKSTLLTELAARLSRGQLDGALRGVPVSTILATAEDSLAATVVPRLLAAGADLARVHLPTEGNLLLPDHLDSAAAWIARTGARLVVLDPLVAHLAERINSWRDQDVRRVLAPLVRLAEELNIAVTAVVHLNKTDTPDVFARVGGSVGIGAAARSLLLAAPDPAAGGAGAYILAHAKSNLAEKAPPLRYRIESRTIAHGGTTIHTSGVSWLGEAPEVRTEDLLARPETHDRAERQEAEAWLRDALRDGPRPATALYTEAARLGFSSRTLQRAKAAAGVRALRHGGKWTWALP